MAGLLLTGHQSGGLEGIGVVALVQTTTTGSFQGLLKVMES